MADSKNPPVLPEGYDPELAKANKGAAAFEAEKAKEGMQAQKMRDKAAALLKSGLGAFSRKDEEPVKKKAGGSVGYKSGGKVRGCGIAQKGLTKGRMV
jgi:hypothetical protein